MSKKQEVSILKPSMTAAALDFATSTPPAVSDLSNHGNAKEIQRSAERTKTNVRQLSGLVPQGDVRLTANISEEHHIKLKVAAATQRTTIGELIERLIDKSL